MRIKKKWFKRKIFLVIIFIIFISSFLYYHSIIDSTPLFIPRARLSQKKHIPFKKISIIHYTTTFRVLTDSSAKVFSPNLKSICNILDPEEYLYADGVIVNLVDFVRFPSLKNEKDSYRKKYQSQLWLLTTEESPRNSYRTVEMNNITDLDGWFNLTATLKPDSDIHIQYKGYRVKPGIIKLLQNKLNITINHTTVSQPDSFMNGTSPYLNTLTSVLNKEFNERQASHTYACPYTCNQPLPLNFINSLQPYLKPIIPRVVKRNIVYIAWFVSNCHSHSGREEYVLKLRSQPGIHVDIHGDCSSILHSHIIPIQCQKGTPQCMEKTLLNYRFYLSFENSKCDTYITEKYWMQGLNGQSIPIVMGAKREHYRRIAVPNSYIHVDDYPTVEQLANELHRLNRNDSEYIKYLQWTQLYDVDGMYAPSAGYDFYSTLCFLGHYQRLHAMKYDNEQIDYLLQRIRDIFDIGKMRLPNFNWETARTKLIRLSEFYNPEVTCWDNEYPSNLRRIYNHWFAWWKLF